MSELPAIVTKEYRTLNEFNRDAPKMAAQGYRVVSTTDGKTKMNFAQQYVRGLTFSSKQRLIVTYQLG